MGVNSSFPVDDFQYLCVSSDQFQDNGMNTLPSEVIEIIFGDLGCLTLLRCGIVCKYWRFEHLNDNLWKSLFLKKFGWTPAPKKSYRDSFIRQMKKQEEKSRHSYREVAKRLHHGMNYLHELEIKDAMIKDLPPYLDRVPLRKLSVLYTRISYFPEVINSLSDTLCELNLGYNNIRTISSNIGQLKNLIKLQLNNNKLVKLPAEIGNLEKLQVLDLFYNKIQELPEEIENLSRLETLDISNNRITSLPKNIGQCTHLVNIQAPKNLIKSLPASIELLENLMVFNLSGNHLEDVPPELFGLLHLKELNLFSNCKLEIDHYLVSKMESTRVFI
eukprot:TRINITY_DN8767_c0_g1_i1.p1 TRINITY_DN8767_c0_g1~~TRINITY_DN8767_c0_g1_i1.p1  ORF type:complete len:331 (-),score=56.84 TRINITY_DN8767_c0_g1_i1:120-1112(-)